MNPDLYEEEEEEEEEDGKKNLYAGWRPEPDRLFVKELLLKDCEEHPNSFREEIINTRTPVKLIGGFKDTEFECLLQWSNDFLREKCKEEKETVIVERVVEDEDEDEDEQKEEDNDDDDEGANAFGKGTRERMQFADFLTSFERGDHTQYLSASNGERFDKVDGRPEILSSPLKSLVNPFMLFGNELRRKQWSNERRERDLTALDGEGKVPLRPKLMGWSIISTMNVWMGRGTKGETSSGLHHDFHDNLYVLARGFKRFELYAPSECEKMYLKGRVTRVCENGMICYDDETPSYGKEFEMAKERVEREQKRLEKQWATERGEVEKEKREKNEEEEEEEDDDEDFEFDEDTFVDDYVDSDEEEAEEEGEETEEKDEVVNNNSNKRHKTGAEGKKKKASSKPLPKSFSTVDKSNLDRFPKFKQAKKLTCELKAGEMLFLPAGWFHEVFSSEKNVFQTKPGFEGHMALNYWFQPHSKEGVEIEGPHGVSSDTPPSRRMIFERDFELWLNRQKWYEPPEMEKYHYEIPSDTDSDPMEQERSRKLKEWMENNKEEVERTRRMCRESRESQESQ